jgi:hypothetical protein
VVSIWLRVVVEARIDTEFLAGMGELFRIGEAAVHHQRPLAS